MNLKKICFIAALALGAVTMAADNGGKVNPQNSKKTPAVTQKKDAKKTPKKQSEMTVTADSMTYSMDNSIIYLEGNVQVEDEIMVLNAKKMTVKLDKDRKPVEVEATEGVTVRKLSTAESASGDIGTYDAKKDIITLRGNCVIVNKEQSMRGQVVIYDRKKGTIRAQRASITLPVNQKDGENGSFLPDGKKNDK